MDYLTYVLFFLAGGLLSHLLFYRGPGPFEKTLWYGLHQGKRVIVCIDDQAFIFELINNRLRITQGTSEFTDPESIGPSTQIGKERSDYGMVSNDLANGCDHKSTDPSAPGV